MPTNTYIVHSGRDMNGETQHTTVRADTFTTDDSFVFFKVGSVIVKAIQKFSVESVELVDPPNGNSPED